MIGEFATRLTIWAALMLYGCSVICYLDKELWLARLAWTVGCVCYLVHVAFAFHFFHDWSHQIASGTTAIQTEAVVGLKTSIGIYVNYLFTIVWTVDTVFWLLVGNERYAKRNPRTTWLLHGFFIFMILNGAVVFTTGISRLIGAMLLSVILINFGLAGLKKLQAKPPKS